jgi:anti-sigma factor RsiW
MIYRPVTEAELHAYVDGQLSAERVAAVESHLAINVKDAANVSAWRQQNESLNAALERVLDEPIPARLSLDPINRPNGGGLRVMDRSHRALIAASIAFVAGALVGAGGLTLVERSPIWSTTSTDVAATMARAALDAHQVFIPEILHPVEVTGAYREQLLQWLSKRLGYPMGLPDLKSEGYALIGGRLLSGPHGPAALFMFENSTGTRLTLYCGRLQPVANTAFHFKQTDGIETVYWTDDNIGFALTGSVGHEALQRVAQLVFGVMEHQEQKRPS